jgi:hypothetical protein
MHSLCSAVLRIMRRFANKSKWEWLHRVFCVILLITHRFWCIFHSMVVFIHLSVEIGSYFDNWSPFNMAHVSFWYDPMSLSLPVIFMLNKIFQAHIAYFLLQTWNYTVLLYVALWWHLWDVVSALKSCSV